MSNQPLVSIVTPLFNRVNLVGESIDSVIGQTYPNWEMIIVDDGSTDGSYEYVQQKVTEEPRIKILKRDRNPKGAPACRNIGLEKARGEFVIFLDSDDILAPHCLQQRVKAFSDFPDKDFLVFPIQYFEQSIGDRKDIFFRYFHQDYITSFLLKSHWITMSPIWKKDALLLLHGFDEELACMQDGDLHLRALVDGMRFKVFRDATLVDGYLRVAQDYDRISTNVNPLKLDSKVKANYKMFHILKEKNQLTPIRKSMLAAHFLNIAWNFNLQGYRQRASTVWKLAIDKEMVDKKTYKLGKLFIHIRSLPLIRSSRILAGATKRIFQLFMPKFLLKL